MPKKIEDGFTGKLGSNGKPLSRQRLWQLRRQAQGKCKVCGEKAVDGTLCQIHKDRNVVAMRERMRKRKSCKRHYYGAESYKITVAKTE